jgi:signal transduction histidine kinase
MTQQPTWLDQMGTIVHDLKHPIASAKLSIDMMQYQGELNERQIDLQERALTSLDELELMVNSLLELTWIESDLPLQLLPSGVDAIVETAMSRIEDAAQRKDVTIYTEFAPDIPEIDVDERRLEQVFVNLLGNAVKYNHKGGSIWVTLSAVKDGVQAAVRDNGIGIPPEDQERVFDRYYRSRNHTHRGIEGNGLGLSIVKAVIEKHGGRIWLESLPEHGTTISFFLPRNPPSDE